MSETEERFMALKDPRTGEAFAVITFQEPTEWQGAEVYWLREDRAVLKAPCLPRGFFESQPIPTSIDNTPLEIETECYLYIIGKSALGLDLSQRTCGFLALSSRHFPNIISDPEDYPRTIHLVDLETKASFDNCRFMIGMPELITYTGNVSIPPPNREPKYWLTERGK